MEKKIMTIVSLASLCILASSAFAYSWYRPPKPTCQSGYLNAYRCSGNYQQQEYQSSSCATSWINSKYCQYGCANNACKSTPKLMCQSVPMSLDKQEMTQYVAEFSSKESSKSPYITVNGQNITVIADSEVMAVTPCTNYGYSGSMRVQSFNLNVAFPREGSRIYIKANLPSSITSISSCEMNLYEDWDSWLGTYSVVKANEVTDNSWIELGITWNNQPCDLYQQTFNSNCNTFLDAKLVNQRYIWYSFNIQQDCVDALSDGTRTVGLVLYAW